MDIKRDLERALRDLQAAKAAIAGELEKGGNLPHAYAKLSDAERKIKDAIRSCD
ncbi:hypothetical protein [Janthinobacterium rivuli]|uniref:hypothetical protein n=1 Tax=Janthinobacterium sp. FT68W TaxID=2654255 RepID=UPI00186B24A6|nr:hypothetical protein [Janthinobacterium sp. FT68W]